jgi:hypothetical protein
LKPATNRQKGNKTLKQIEPNNRKEPKMKRNSYLKPAWTHNGSIRTDLPLTVTRKANKKKLMETTSPGQLLCVGKIYLKTHDDLIRIK